MRNKKFILIIIILVLVSVSIIGLTYAYFTIGSRGNTLDESAVITAGSFELTYYDGNNTITLTNIMPDTTVEKKTFSVKNTGTNIINNYGVYIEDVINELKYTEDLDYTLTCKEYYNNNYIKDCNGSSGDFPSSDNIIATNSINVNYVHEYELVIKYVETNKNQSEDMNKKISGNIKIYDLNDIVNVTGSITNYTLGDYITLNDKQYKILSDGTYFLPTVEPGINNIKIFSSDGTLKWENSFEITKDTNPSIDETTGLITINDESELVTINMTKGDTENIVLDIVSVDNE